MPLSNVQHRVQYMPPQTYIHTSEFIKMRAYTWYITKDTVSIWLHFHFVSKQETKELLKRFSIFHTHLIIKENVDT